MVPILTLGSPTIEFPKERPGLLCRLTPAALVTRAVLARLRRARKRKPPPRARRALVT